MLADAEQAIRLRPDDMANVWDTRAVAKRELGQVEASIPDFTEAITRDRQNPTYYNNRGQTFVRLKRFDKALADLDRCISLDPNYWAAHWWRGVANRFLGNLDAAIADFQAATRRNPKHTRSWLHLFITLREAGRSGEADANIQEAAARGSEFDAWGQNLVAFYAGEVDCGELLAAAGGDSRKLCQAYYYVGEAEFLPGRQAKAREWFEKCVGTGQQRLAEYEFAEWRLRTLGGLGSNVPDIGEKYLP